VRTVAKIFLILCVVFGATASHAEDANKQTFSLDSLSVPMIAPDSSITLAPQRPTSGGTGPVMQWPAPIRWSGLNVSA
jgi:hypothetical protein